MGVTMDNVKLGGINKISDTMNVVTYLIGDKRFKVFVPVDESVNKAVKNDYERRKKDGLLI